MIRFRSAALVSAVLWAGSIAGQAAAVQVSATRASHGVYTTAQARRGGGVFEDVCLACHTVSRFRGTDFAAKWGDKPLATLYKAVTTMPQGEPDSLDPQDYADVVAYLLSINAYPDGPLELPPSAEAVAAIWLDAKAP